MTSLYQMRPPDADFFVPGRAAPGGSKKAFHHAKTGRIVVMDDAKGNRDWKARVASFASRLFVGPPLDVPLEAWAHFTLLRPKGHFGTGRNAAIVRASAPTHPTTKPDATKIWRAVEDALTGIVWRDDSQVVIQHVTKAYGPVPGVRVIVRSLPS